MKKPKEQKLKNLPVYKKISVDDIPPMSVGLCYGGNKVTETVGNTKYKHPYYPPAYHAFIYQIAGVILNVGKYKTQESIVDFCTGNERIDIIAYKDLTMKQRMKLLNVSMLDVDKPKLIKFPTYDWKGFSHFGFKFVKPSKKKDFCSDNCVDIFDSQPYKISDKPSERTAPWDLFEYALKHKETCNINTLWIGKDFNKNYKINS